MTWPRILVLGATGMLGHRMFLRLQEQFDDVTGTTRGFDPPFDNMLRGFDVWDWRFVRRAIVSHAPNIIVNCVGAIKQREATVKRMIEVNALLPHRLTHLADRVIHFSTDCVFSGDRTSGSYNEADAPDARDIYGQTKHLGELPSSSNALTLRTSFIGRELHSPASLLEWFLSQRDTCRGFTNHIYSGVTTPHIAELVADIIAHRPHLSGLYHVTAPPISKFDLLVHLRDAFKFNIDVQPDDTHPPCNRRLDGSRFDAAVGRTQPSWPTLCAELARTTHPLYRRL